MAYLETLNGTQAGKRYDLTASKYVLGRHPDCDVVIDEGAVSRHHAQILLVDGVVHLEDLRSRNGTFVNGQSIEQRHQLTVGDRIQVCDVSFKFDDDAGTMSSKSARTVESSSFTPALLVDDDESHPGGSTVMSKLDVSSSRSSITLTASPEVKLRALLEITQNLGKALALDDVLPKVLDSLFKIFIQADRGFIVLRIGEAGTLVPRWTKVRRGEDDGTIRISRTIVNKVIETREAILSADAASDSRFDMSQSIADFRIRSMMCAPLIDSDNRVVGVLQIDTLDQRSGFQPEDLEVLVSIASQAAVAIDNAQLHEAALRQKSIERDLELAQTVQRGFLPEHPPTVEGYHFFDFYRAANHVGGDYYDYIELPDRRVAIIVADVVGHGIAAALMMAKLSAEVHISLATTVEPAEAVTRLNAKLAGESLSDRFITLVMAVLDPVTHTLTIVNAGHMLPIIRRGLEKYEEVGDEEVGLPLSVDDRFEYQQCQTTLDAGNLLALYTDGINEAMNRDGQLYGIDRIREQIKSEVDGVVALGERVIGDVERFVGEVPQNDDMCLVCAGRASG